MHIERTRDVMDETTERPPDPGVSGPDSPGSAPESLYAKHIKIQSRRVTGVFRSLKWLATWGIIGIYVALPWLRWDRGSGAPDQAFLFDIPGRRAYFLGIEIWPQEVYYLTGILIFAAIALFLITALAGRVWCGFVCPQTVWTDLFVLVERVIEGDRNARIKLDRAPWTVGKLTRKSLKHLIWMAIGGLTGYAFVLYFEDAFRLTGEIFTGQASATIYWFIAMFAGSTYLFAAFAREQICIYMCPWPRFQGAMFDEHSLLVTYEDWRGEPRGKVRKGGATEGSFDNRGDCVDCRMCVQVCPTGVDIREGNQLACIGCALCVDACNAVMDRFGLPRGLITYDSEFNQVARSRGEPTRSHLLRPRTLIYLGVLAIVTAVMVASLFSRARLEINVQRDRAPLFVTLSDGGVRNGYTYKILNMEREIKTYTLTVKGIEGATLEVIGHAPKGSVSAPLRSEPDHVDTFKVFVRAPREALAGKSTDISFVLTDTASGMVFDHASVFAGPGD